MDTKKTLVRSIRDALVGIAVFGVAIPFVDFLVAYSPAIEESLPGWAGTSLGAVLLVAWRFLRDYWKHGGGKARLMDMFDEYGPLAMLALILSPLFVGCTTMHSETVNADGTYYKHKFTQAPFSKTDMTDMVYRSEVDADGAWKQHIGASATGLDNTPQADALSILGLSVIEGLKAGQKVYAPEGVE